MESEALDTATDAPLVVLTDAVITELAALGAAIGSNCEPCLKYHYAQARKLGLTNEQILVAVRIAQKVKDAPADNILDLAAKLARVDRTVLAPSTHNGDAVRSHSNAGGRDEVVS